MIELGFEWWVGLAVVTSGCERGAASTDDSFLVTRGWGPRSWAEVAEAPGVPPAQRVWLPEGRRCSRLRDHSSRGSTRAHPA